MKTVVFMQPLKKRILVTYIEAGFGHISTANSIADAIEELVQAAMDQKLTAIGFSGHAHTEHDERYCMSVVGTQKYQEEIAVLRKRYEGAIKVFCGLEMDYFSDVPTEDYDYVIGSVHAAFFEGATEPFSHIDFSTWEFPAAFEITVTSLGCEDFSIFDDDCCYYSDCFHFILIFFKIYFKFI